MKIVGSTSPISKVTIINLQGVYDSYNEKVVPSCILCNNNESPISVNGPWKIAVT